MLVRCCCVSVQNAVMMKSQEARTRDAASDSEALKVSSEKASGGQVAPARSPEPRAPAVRASTKLREAYFLSFCELVRTRVPDAVLMLTGGWRSGIAMSAAVLSDSVAFVGLARPIAVMPAFPNALLASPQLSKKQIESAVEDAVTLPTYSCGVGSPIETLNKTSEAALENFVHQSQMARIARGEKTDVHADLTVAAKAYFLTVTFMRTYVWEPRRKPRQTAALVALGLGTVGAVVAASFAKVQPLEVAQSLFTRATAAWQKE
jgi:hypothetical protein